MSAPARPARRPVYILLDTSGSTVRDGFGSACWKVLPQLVDAAGSWPGVLLSVLTYGTQAKVLLSISEPGDIRFIPALVPAGLSSLAAGLQLLADSVRQDISQLAADGLACMTPGMLVIADGLPTDPAASLLAARDALDAAIAGLAGPTAHVPLPVYASRPDEGDLLAAAGLRMTFRPLAAGTPAGLATAVLNVFVDVLGS